MTGLPLRSSTLSRWKTNPKGLHSMYAGLSRVKPRCALTLACQKTNPKGLWSLIVASGSNYVLTIILSMRTWLDLLIIPNKSHILQPTKHPIKPHNYNTIASDVNTHLPPPTTSAANNPPQNRFTRHAIPLRRRFPPQITLLKIALHATQFLRHRHPPQITPTGLVFW